MLAGALAEWFEEAQRPLPWRSTYDPYHVWVSEVMLQQTQVDTVLPYYTRFIAAFPDVAVLAAAPEEEALKLWSGLGYYSRARNLMRAARVVMDAHDGRIPDDYAQLIALPGIGRYMAGAILSIAFNQPYPIVDGNVRRVLSRVYGWEHENPREMWNAAAALAAAGPEPRLINQGLMELGARICTFRSPRCLVCPIARWCVASRTGMQDRIPPVRKRPATVHVPLFAVVCRRRGRYLMKPADGMWEFPTFAELPPGEWRRVGDCRHTITHHRLDVAVMAGTLPQSNGLEWKDVDSVPLTSLTRKILRAWQAGAARH